MSIDYFVQLWNENKEDERSYKRGDKAAWDRRVDEFNYEGPDERLDIITGLLLEKQMLTPASTVLDIGCGPGKFAIEFARTAHSVTGVDISPKMLQSAAANAAAKGAGNTEFLELDWHKADLDELGWSKKFSLVTAIMSPALGSKEGLDKVLEASSECGLLCHFVERQDSILDQLKRMLGRQVVNQFGNIGLYCSFNILWYYKMFPEIAYFDTERARVRTLAEANRHYLNRMGVREDLTPAQQTAILEFLQSQAVNGLVTEKTTAKIACVYWRK